MSVAPASNVVAVRSQAAEQELALVGLSYRSCKRVDAGRVEAILGFGTRRSLRVAAHAVLIGNSGLSKDFLAHGHADFAERQYPGRKCVVGSIEEGCRNSEHLG